MNRAYLAFATAYYAVYPTSRHLRMALDSHAGDASSYYPSGTLASPRPRSFGRSQAAHLSGCWLDACRSARGGLSRPPA
eukprot:8161817-Heterocapsa_arctica.AAC.1